MEKLIELLNEYENEEADVYIRYWNYYQNGFHLLEYGQTYSELLMISKKYEFIKWLVENDKIDRRGIDKPIEYIEFYSDYNLDSETHHYSDVDSLIMLLSIQDEPIRFLCEILK